MTGFHSRTGLTLLGVALYGGPVLAGLARHDWSVVPVLAALFLLYVAASRKPDLTTGAGRAGLAIMAATQLALVALAWGIGLALAARFGGYVLPLWAPVATPSAASALDLTFRPSTRPASAACANWWAPATSRPLATPSTLLPPAKTPRPHPWPWRHSSARQWG